MIAGPDEVKDVWNMCIWAHRHLPISVWCEGLGRPMAYFGQDKRVDQRRQAHGFSAGLLKCGPRRMVGLVEHMFLFLFLFLFSHRDFNDDLYFMGLISV